MERCGAGRGCGGGARWVWAATAGAARRLWGVRSCQQRQLSPPISLLAPTGCPVALRPPAHLPAPRARQGADEGRVTKSVGLHIDCCHCLENFHRLLRLLGLGSLRAGRQAGWGQAGKPAGSRIGGVTPRGVLPEPAAPCVTAVAGACCALAANPKLLTICISEVKAAALHRAMHQVGVVKGGATCVARIERPAREQRRQPGAAAGGGWSRSAKTHLGTNWAEAMTFLTSPGPTSIMRAFSASMVSSRGRPERPAERGLPAGGSVLPRPSWRPSPAV
jgi:hypothetical protein